MTDVETNDVNAAVIVEVRCLNDQLWDAVVNGEKNEVSRLITIGAEVNYSNKSDKVRLIERV